MHEEDRDDMTPIGQIIRVDRGNDNRCFGCGPQNAAGLKMAFARVGDRAIECQYTVPDKYCGMEGVVHGGFQAVLLDEAVSLAAYEHWPPGTYAVTAELALEYERPVPVGSPVIVRGELIAEDERDYHVVGAIVDPSGKTLTTAKGRLRKRRRETA